MDINDDRDRQRGTVRTLNAEHSMGTEQVKSKSGLAITSVALALICNMCTEQLILIWDTETCPNAGPLFSIALFAYGPRSRVPEEIDVLSGAKISGRLRHRGNKTNNDLFITQYL